MDAKNLTMEVPLTFLENGAIRIGKTRVGLEIVIHAYDRGETVESILRNWDVLKPLEVHLVIAYYLANREAVEEYLADYDRTVEEVMRKIDASMTPEQKAVMERLRALSDQRELDRVQAAP